MQLAAPIRQSAVLESLSLLRAQQLLELAAPALLERTRVQQTTATQAALSVLLVSIKSRQNKVLVPLGKFAITLGSMKK